MVQVYRFKISVKSASGSVRQIVSVPYYDNMQCQCDMRLQGDYLLQLKLRIVSYSIESEYMDSEDVIKELGYGF